MNLLFFLTSNPMIVHALRSRRLNWRMITALALALLAYCPACLIIGPYFLTGLFSSSGNVLYQNLDDVGQAIFYVTAIFLLILVTLFAPTMAVSAIAGEKQRQTLDLLLITLLPARSIVIGKLVSTLIYTLFLIAIAWPVILISVIIGGVAVIELLVAMLLLIVTAVAFTVIGLFVSSLSQTTTNATMLTYGVVLPGLLIAPFLGMLPVTILLNLANVSYKLESAINFYGWSLAVSLNPISAAIYSGALRSQGGGIILASQPYHLLFPWVIYIIFYSFVAWFLAQLTIHRLERMNE